MSVWPHSQFWYLYDYFYLHTLSSLNHQPMALNRLSFTSNTPLFPLPMFNHYFKVSCLKNGRSPSEWLLSSEMAQSKCLVISKSTHFSSYISAFLIILFHCRALPSIAPLHSESLQKAREKLERRMLRCSGNMALLICKGRRGRLGGCLIKVGRYNFAAWTWDGGTRGM